MARRPRLQPWLSQCCYHVSNTCYRPAQVFGSATMRQRAVERLRTLKDRYPIRFLDYLLYRDGYRLLVEAEHPGLISEALRSFHAGTTSDYYVGHEWEGPVWRMRGAAFTMVEKGPHALRCALDMDFEMVGTGDPTLFHPLLWKHSGCRELSEVRTRYRVLNRDAMRRCLMDRPRDDFRDWYVAATTARWKSGEIAPEPWWRTALVVGDRELCETVADTLPPSRLELKCHPAVDTVPELEDGACWTVNMSRSRTKEYIRSLAPPKQCPPGRRLGPDRPRTGAAGGG